MNRRDDSASLYRTWFLPNPVLHCGLSQPCHLADGLLSLLILIAMLEIFRMSQSPYLSSRDRKDCDVPEVAFWCWAFIEAWRGKSLFWRLLSSWFAMMPGSCMLTKSFIVLQIFVTLRSSIRTLLYISYQFSKFVQYSFQDANANFEGFLSKEGLFDNGISVMAQPKNQEVK